MLKSLIQSNDKKECKVDFSKQLININKEEIDRLIFNSIKTNLVEKKKKFLRKLFQNFHRI